MNLRSPIDILLVEDNPADVRLTQEAFKLNQLDDNLYVAEDGVEAMRFLNKENDYSESPTPDIILLDLNLPLKSGKEVLVEVKSNKKLKQIPVIILTTSNSEKEVQEAYSNHANCYITKPVDLNTFVHVMKEIDGFWFSLVQLPGKVSGR